MLVQLQYELHFAAPFHFGTGIRTGLIDRTVIRDAGRYLYVPASTLKGVLREHCEQISHFYAAEGKERVASPHDVYESLAEFGRPTPNLISRIFGSALYPGTLLFQDARQQDEAIHTYRSDLYKDAQVGVSTQVRIDRRTGTAVGAALYTSEFGISDLVFTGSIKGQLHCIPVEVLSSDRQTLAGEAYNQTPSYSLLLLLAGLLMIERLGGNKSAGKGQCYCEITDLQLDRRDCPTSDWREWINWLEVLSYYSYYKKEREQQA